MQKDRWYRCVVQSAIPNFPTGSVAFVRYARYHTPLAIGPVLVVFDPSRMKVARFAEKLGIRQTLRLRPSNVNPAPLDVDRQEQVEEAYIEYMRKNPPPKRVINPRFRKRAAALNQPE